jgi:hypothetical protein
MKAHDATQQRGLALGALTVGAPQLILPQGADQFANADAVTAAGAALRLGPDDLSPSAIAEEIALMPSPDEVARPPARIRLTPPTVANPPRPRRHTRTQSRIIEAVTEEDLIQTMTDLPGVVAETATEASGAPEVAWGDSFFYYDPDDSPNGRMFPFATLVIKDYPGFDEASDLNRPGVFRFNLNVGREAFTQLFGFPPAEFAGHQDDFDYTVVDQVIPHPVYAKQGWISVVAPGPHTADQLSELITRAHQRARDRYRPPA